MTNKRETIGRWISQAARAAAEKRGTFTIEEIASDVVQQLDARNNPLISEHLTHSGMAHVLGRAKKQHAEKFDEFILAMATYKVDPSEASLDKVRLVYEELEALAEQPEN